MAATLDDLLYVASAIRSEIKFQAEESRSHFGKGSSGGGGGGSGAQPSGGIGAALDSFVTRAAKAGVALTAFTVMFERLITGLGAGLAKFVSLANPAVVIRFNMAMENAMSALGRVFIPILERFTLIIQAIGNAIESLSPQAKTLIASLAAGGGLAAAFGAIATGVTLLIRVLGVWPAILTALVGAFAGVLTTTASGKEVLGAFSSILKMVGTVFEQIAKVLVPIAASVAGPVLKAIGAVLGSIGEMVGRVMAAAAPGLKAVAELFAAIVPVLGELIRAVVPLIEVALVPFTVLTSLLARIISSVLVPILEQLAAVIGRVADFIQGVVNRFLKMLGMAPGETSEYDPNKNRAQAVRQSQITDLRSFANRSYTMAYGGAGADVPRATLEEAKKHTTRLDDIIGLLGGNKGADGGRGKELGDWGYRNFGETGRSIGRGLGQVGGFIEKGVMRVADPLDILGHMRKVFS